MQADRIPRTIEDFLEELDRRLNRLELRERHGFIDTDPGQVPYDELPADSRDNDIVGGEIPPQQSDVVIFAPVPTVPPHSHDEAGNAVTLPQGLVLRLVWDGDSYPPKPDVANAYFEFVGPVDPKTLFLMTHGDTWTQTD